MKSQRRGIRFLGLLVPVIAVALLSPAGALASKKLKTTLIAPRTSPAATPDGFARTADGTLHVVYETNTAWGMSANGIGAVSISPSGHVGAQVQALAWGPQGGSPNGIPGLAVMPGGTLEATFGGSPGGGDDGPWGISSTDGGSTWSPPVNVGSGSMQFGDSHVNLENSNGTPVLSAGCCGNIVIQQGFGPGAPTYQLTNGADGAAGNVDSAVDAATGAVVDSWGSNDGSGGLWLQQVAPSQGAAEKAPIPTQYGTGEPLIIAGRDTGPGVFAAYPADYGSTTHVRLLRYGGGSVAVGSVKGLHANVVGDATGPDGRIWVMWYGTIGTKGVIAVTRSNKAATRFEPIQQYRFADWPFLFVLHGDGRLGPLDLLINGTAPPEPLVNGIYYSRLLPELSSTVSVHETKSGKFKLRVTVTDAGDAVSGAEVSASGQSKTTNASGKAKLTITGTSGAHVTVKVSHPGYQELRERVKL
jgi:hypothetical protein